MAFRHCERSLSLLDSRLLGRQALSHLLSVIKPHRDLMVGLADGREVAGDWEED
jgi:hypothetical protein